MQVTIKISSRYFMISNGIYCALFKLAHNRCKIYDPIKDVEDFFLAKGRSTCYPIANGYFDLKKIFPNNRSAVTAVVYSGKTAPEKLKQIVNSIKPTSHHYKEQVTYLLRLICSE